MHEYIYVSLTPSDLSTYNHYIPEKILKVTSSQDPSTKILLIGAMDNQTPIGICIGQLNPDLHLLDILHVEVRKSHRNQQVGRTLLAKVQEEAVKAKAEIFSLVYELNTPETQAIEKIVLANSWKGSRPFLIRAVFDLVGFNAPLLHLNLKYPKGYKEFRWKYLKERQRNSLMYREESGQFPHAISPFQEENLVEPQNSLGLEHEGRVVGWMITHRVDPETVRYTALYSEPSHEHTGIAIKLIVGAILLHKQKPTKWALIEIPYLQVHPTWIRFVKQRLLPFAESVTYLQQAWHTL